MNWSVKLPTAKQLTLGHLRELVEGTAALPADTAVTGYVGHDGRNGRSFTLTVRCDDGDFGRVVRDVG